MRVENGSHGALTLGVEEEFLLVDAAGRLSRQGPDVATRTDAPDGELQQELVRCQVESATGICSSIDEVVEQLGGLRRRLARTAADRQLRLLPIGCPVLAEERSPEITPNPRYERAAAEFGATARVAATCGCHVHVAIPDKETGVRLIDHLRPWLPLLLTVTANSVFADGADSGYASWRYPLWSRWPSAGPPPAFGSLDQYESTVETMLRSGAIIDRGMVYWDIRLSDDQPTLEFRIGDVAAHVDEAALLAAVIRGLVRTALEEIGDGRPAPALSSEALRANLWRASRDGFTGQVLHPKTGYLAPVAVQWAETVELIRPALKEYGDDEFVEQGFARLRENGGGARRQRAAFDRRENLHDVIDLLAVEPGRD
ncbi:glutamate--cysteine ligase [Amycolatopsis sp. PS_44_ISF1]|uniref:carboxylate-amine ligase n=1 Tax=Amycolatopsis sp. PS_44_ISF1 TaxID=2974917 RepID=UPI0028DDA2ED|nr:glutamate--cysteine ligase [Amycolatopsis sp. PS_44_ISF1]MDT8914478.1 glutamate--cysteine ligase [Amycolatopsis sp. PS_44_ISF1]